MEKSPNDVQESVAAHVKSSAIADALVLTEPTARAKALAMDNAGRRSGHRETWLSQLTAHPTSSGGM